MGNQSSKEKSPTSPVANHSSSSNSSTTNARREKEPKASTSHNNASKPPPHLEKHSASSSPSQRYQHQNSISNDQSKQVPQDDGRKERFRATGKSTPVQVPRGADPRRQRGPDSQFESSGPPKDPNFVPHSNLNFPPRMPLPIEEEFHAPYSPTITAQEFSSSLHEEDFDGAIPRQSSVISSTTLEEEELGNELQPYPYEAPPQGLVPIRLQWTQGGEKVYVTGTFVGWNRKFRMSRDSSTTAHHATVLQLPPGTHHVKFIVDGEMQLSNELPTAVDYTNILVNYVEVSADDIPKESSDDGKVPKEFNPPQVPHKGTEAKDHALDSGGKTQQPVEGEPKTEPVFWGKVVPKYLHDVDLPEQSRRYQRAARGVSDFSTPPGLPLFLGKSILNGTTPMKDDSSVLNMPNHTVLNHLATSSIKHDVLATSITTRYKRKYVTTMVYKPTEE